jgi:hypothetical protein
VCVCVFALCSYSVKTAVDISNYTSLIGHTAAIYSYQTKCFDHQPSIFRPFKICTKCTLLYCHLLVILDYSNAVTTPRLSYACYILFQLLLLDFINLKTFKQMEVVGKFKNELRETRKTTQHYRSDTKICTLKSPRIHCSLQ